MFRHALNRTNSSVIQLGGESALMLVISIVVAILLLPSDPLGVKSFTSSDLIVTAIYSLVILVILYLLVLLYYCLDERRKIFEEKDIGDLGKCRSDGVSIRNKLLDVKEVSQLIQIIKSYNEWEIRTLGILSRISPGEAEWLKTLDRMPQVGGIFLNADHERYARVMNEKLHRLDMLLRKHLDIPLDNMNIK